MYENQVMNWQPDSGGNTRFTIINIIVLTVLLSTAMYISSLEIPEVERSNKTVVPERVAQFILRKEKRQPKPKPVLKPVVKVEPKIEPKPKPKPKKQRKSIVADNKKPLTDNQKKIRERASKSGLLALSNVLADLMDTSDVSAMVSGKVNKSSTSKKSNIDTDILSAGNKSGRTARINVQDRSSTISISKLGAQERIEVSQALMKDANTGSGGKNSNRKKRSSSASGNYRSDEDIAFVMDQNKGKLYTVYRRARRSNPGLKGLIVFDITILPSGKVSEVVIRSSELDDPKLEMRLLARVKSFDFGAREGDSISVIYPVEFLPS